MRGDHHLPIDNNDRRRQVAELGQLLESLRVLDHVALDKRHTPL